MKTPDEIMDMARSVGDTGNQDEASWTDTPADEIATLRARLKVLEEALEEIVNYDRHDSEYHYCGCYRVMQSLARRALAKGKSDDD